MEKDELFELVVVLTAKNMALEEEIKRLKKQTDRLIDDLNEYNRDDEEFDFDYDDDLDVPDYDENNYCARKDARELLDGIEEQDYEANCLHEKDVELIQKFNAINSRLSGTNSRVVELEKRVHMFDLDYAEIKSKVLDLDSWNVAKALHDRVTELEEKEDNNGN